MNDYRAKEFAPADKVCPTLPDGVGPHALISLLWASLATDEDPTPEHHLAEPIWQMLDYLTTDERRVVDMYYGITCLPARDKLLVVKDVCLRTGLPQSEIRELLRSALDKIGRHLQAWLVQPHEQTWRFQVRGWLPELREQKD